MKSPHPDRAALAAFVLGHHDEIADRAALEAHVGECEACLDEVGREARLEMLLDAAGREDAFAAVLQVPRRRPRWPLVAAAGAVAVAAAGAYALWPSTTAPRETSARETAQVPTAPVAPVDRPAWAVGLAPSEARCTETDDGLSCAGSSGYRRTREEAREEASDIAIEALVDHALARGTHAVKAQQVLNLIVRKQVLASGQVERIRRARRIVADRAKVGSRDGWYWEKYQALEGGGTEFLVYSRFSATHAELAELRDRHAFVSVDGGILVPAVPGIGWALDPGDRRPWFVLGPGRLAKLGIRRGDVILLDQRRNADRMHSHVAAGHALVWRRGLDRPVPPSQLR